MAEQNIFETLKKEATYALDSHSLNLVYETYGKVKMAFTLGAISDVQFKELNTMLVRDGINNSKAKLE